MNDLAFFKNLPVPAALLTKDGVRIDVNNAFEEFCKRSREESIGLPLEKLYTKEDHQKNQRCDCKMHKRRTFYV